MTMVMPTVTYWNGADDVSNPGKVLAAEVRIQGRRALIAIENIWIRLCLLKD